MKVQFNPLLAVLALLVGAFFVVSDVLLYVEHGRVDIGVVAGPAFLALGVGYLVGSCFTYEPATRTIVIRALAGRRRRFGGDGGWLQLQGDRIVHVRPDGVAQRLPLARWYLRRAQWDAVVADLSRQPAGGPAAR